jgi:hypothetical protein
MNRLPGSRPGGQGSSYPFWLVRRPGVKLPTVGPSTPQRSSRSRSYADVVFSIRVTRPQNTTERYWNVAQTFVTWVSLVLPFVLKLTGAITWSWWWVALSPIWMSAALQTLLVTGWAVLAPRRLKPWHAE